MAKFRFTITAHIVSTDDSCNEDVMEVYAKEYNENPYDYMLKPIWFLATKAMQCLKWDWDDGDDSADSVYCQYVSYTDDANYMLATWDVIEEG